MDWYWSRRVRTTAQGATWESLTRQACSFTTSRLSPENWSRPCRMFTGSGSGLGGAVMGGAATGAGGTPLLPALPMLLPLPLLRLFSCSGAGASVFAPSAPRRATSTLHGRPAARRATAALRRRAAARGVSGSRHDDPRSPVGGREPVELWRTIPGREPASAWACAQPRLGLGIDASLPSLSTRTMSMAA